VLDRYESKFGVIFNNKNSAKLQTPKEQIEKRDTKEKEKNSVQEGRCEGKLTRAT